MHYQQKTKKTEFSIKRIRLNQFLAPLMLNSVSYRILQYYIDNSVSEIFCKTIQINCTHIECIFLHFCLF